MQVLAWQKRQICLLRLVSEVPVSVFCGCSTSGICYAPVKDVPSFPADIPPCRPSEVPLCSCCLRGRCRSRLFVEGEEQKDCAEREGCWRGGCYCSCGVFVLPVCWALGKEEGMCPGQQRGTGVGLFVLKNAALKLHRIVHVRNVRCNW